MLLILILIHILSFCAYQFKSSLYYKLADATVGF